MFMSMRMAASACQVRQVRALPRGARMTGGAGERGDLGESMVISERDLRARVGMGSLPSGWAMRL